MTVQPPLPPQDAAAILDDAGFRRVIVLAQSAAGLSIPATKRSMVQSRLNRRLRATGIADFGSYLNYVESGAGHAEREQMIQALTTNVSHFFREAHHFDLLRNLLVPDLLRRARAGERIRLWSAGCSTGQEPYSIAMTLLEADPGVSGLDVRILATDIDRTVLGTGIRGAYDARLLDGVPPALRARHFRAEGDRYRVAEPLRAMVGFRRLNLIETWPMRGPFDAVFCRNVVIYFSEETRRALWPRFARVLAPGGLLFLGHSERIHDSVETGFRSAGVTTYRKGGQEPPGGTAWP